MVPQIETRAICISNDAALGAVISAYFNEPETYVAIFKLPEVKPFAENADSKSDDYVSNIIGGQAATLINNAVARLKPTKIILAGLTAAQKTFCSFVPKDRKIEIDNLQEVESKLAFLGTEFDGTLTCRRQDVMRALLPAKRKKKRLVVSDSASDLPSELDSEQRSGVVIIENEEDISSVIAINCAFAIDALAVLVEPIDKSKIYDVQKHIRAWKERGSLRDQAEVERLIRERIGHIDFTRFDFATFFTEGLPYSLYLKNNLPISYVRRSVKEDLFIFNNIIYEHLDSFEAAVVFSPEEFEEEETEEVIKALHSSGFLVKSLVNAYATVRNFRYYAEHYPYDLLHICSHGGETDGYYVKEHFKDRDGNEHTVEYDEIVGFSPVPGQKMVQVTRKAIFRRFDGYAWMSPELKAQNLPQYVFEDMRKALFDGSIGRNAASRKRVEEPIASSCHIKCYDSIHQGMFWTLASHSSPLIFNNTCSSWNEISLFFIAVGCRGYVGTLWSINNVVAKESAERFYEKLMLGTILGAVSEMISGIRESPNADIYVYWGLHFSTIKKPSGKGKAKVFRELIRAAMAWCEKIVVTKILEVKQNSADILRFILSELKSGFEKEDIAIIQETIAKNPEIKQALLSKERALEWLERGVVQYPTERK